MRLLIANRGEIARRIASTAKQRGYTVARIVAADEPTAHIKADFDDLLRLEGRGLNAYLDGASIIESAILGGFGHIHPGYGFLSESAEFADQCTHNRLMLVSPGSAALGLLGNKTEAIRLAASLGFPTIEGTRQGISKEEALAFFKVHAETGIVIKAVAGGGGRGMRVVRDANLLEESYDRCASEAERAFGSAEVYAEAYLENTRHIEIQIVGDGELVLSLGERDCTIQRRFQKVIEMTPAPNLNPTTLEQIENAAVQIARALKYKGLGTFEFLVDQHRTKNNWAFIEANPRIQVEHTITEESLGVDLVDIQLHIHEGNSLAKLVEQLIAKRLQRKTSIQFRINAERYGGDGRPRRTTGVVTELVIPSLPDIRFDSDLRSGMTISAEFDNLVGKLIATPKSGDHRAAFRLADLALKDFRLEGVETNAEIHRIFCGSADDNVFTWNTSSYQSWLENIIGSSAGAPVADGLQVTEQVATRPTESADQAPEGAPQKVRAIRADQAGRLLRLMVEEGAQVHQGQELYITESMKMEYGAIAPVAGVVLRRLRNEGEFIAEGDEILVIEETYNSGMVLTASDMRGIDDKRLNSYLTREALVMESFHARAAERGRGHGGDRLSLAEKITRLLGSTEFQEIGRFAYAAQEAKRPLEDLHKRTARDGIALGFGTYTGDSTEAGQSQQIGVLAYDINVLAGTQGLRGHHKTDRFIELLGRSRCPLVAFCEGGGGRPGDTDIDIAGGLHFTTFAEYARLRGTRPIVSIASGYTFAGNAVILGISDLIVATRDSNIGLGGPAMIEGGGLGQVLPSKIGPAEMLARRGVVDLVGHDEASCIALARRCLELLAFRSLVPRAPGLDKDALNKLIMLPSRRAYNPTQIVDGIFDAGSFLEIKPSFGLAAITGLCRLNGLAVGVAVSSSKVHGGAIDADTSEKLISLFDLCQRHQLPIIVLVDCPGFMVGPDAESTGQLKKAAELFVIGSRLTVPKIAVVTRRAFGLGAMAMSFGSLHRADRVLAWPQAQFGAMGIEGGVMLARKRELAAISDPTERKLKLDSYIREEEERGSSLNAAAKIEVDDIVMPGDTRMALTLCLKSISDHKGDRISEDRTTK